MFELTRQVRFAIGADSAATVPAAAATVPGAAARVPGRVATVPGRAANGFGGWPPVRGLDAHYAVDVTVAGELETSSQYVVNIVQIDALVRAQLIGLIAAAPRGAPPAPLLIQGFDRLRRAMPTPPMIRLRWWLSPYCHLQVSAAEMPMILFSQRFEFAASHRLHNPNMSEAENRALFGKCNNVHGHGHNYEVEVKLRGEAGELATRMPIDALEQIVAEAAIDRLDHRYLNVEVAEFAALIPTVENIAMVIYRWLSPALKRPGVSLASVTVWETPKTWCEYSQ